MSTIDTPDYQRGVVSAQVLLAAVAAGTQGVTVGVPPNCETLIVITAQFVPLGEPVVQGLTTGVFYPTARGFSVPAGGATSIWFVDVSSVIDAEVHVGLDFTSTAAWWVYSDAAAHVTVPAGQVTAINGTPYVTPLIPTLLPGEALPKEVSFMSNVLAAGGTILAAPGATLRYRLFGAQMAATAAGLSGYLADAGAGVSPCVCAGPGNAVAQLPLQGYPCATNGALTYILNAGAGQMLIAVSYVIEQV